MVTFKKLSVFEVSGEKVELFIFRISVDKVELEKEILRLTSKRTRRFSSVRSTQCGKVPVTSPNHSEKHPQSDEADLGSEEISYHIIVIVSIYGRLEVLIREYDGYVIAIRPEPKDPNQIDGWFSYSDVNLPSDLFGERNWRMPFHSSYLGHGNVEIGDGSLDHMVKVLIDIKEANYKQQKHKRRMMLQKLNVFAGEVPRFSCILRYFILNVGANPWVKLGDLTFWTNRWSKLSAGSILVLLSLLLKKVLQGNDAEDKAKKLMDKARDALKDFEPNNIPVTRDTFLGKIPLKFRGVGGRPVSERDLRIRKQFTLGNEGKCGVFGEDAAGDELYLPLLLSYIDLMKYKRLLVPELIIMKKECAEKVKMIAYKEERSAAEMEMLKHAEWFEN